MSGTVAVLEMGLTPAEFLRCLPHALEGTRWRCREGRVEAEGGGLSVRIRIEPLPERRLGLIRLPVTRVTLEMDGGAAERSAFRARFDRAFQRAGG